MVNLNVVAIVQARMSSSRLPGKVLKPLADATVIEGILCRLQQAKLIDKVVLATSDEISDQPLVEHVRDAGFEVVKGSLDDVLARYVMTALEYPANHYVRVTGDCPFIDPELVDELIAHYLGGEADYASNAIEPTLPDGFDCEVFSADTLMRVERLAKEKIDREHVTHYIYAYPNDFQVLSHTYIDNNSHYRVTLDTLEDYQLITEICKNLPCAYQNARLADILRVLKHSPQLCEINSMYQRNEGLMNE